VLVTDEGAVVFQMGKPARRGEGLAIADALKNWNIPILGFVQKGTAEAGDMIWLDHQTLLVGRGFRTNSQGIAELETLLSSIGVTVVPVPLPYFNGPEDVLHLMSFMSLLDQNLAVILRKLIPVPLFEFLSEREVRLIDIPEEEYD